MRFSRFFSSAACLAIAAWLCAAGCASPHTKTSASQKSLEFVVTADIRQFAGDTNAGSGLFDGVCKAVQEAGAGEFMISPGDIDPPSAIRRTIDRFFGKDYPWVPVVGNHEAETPADMEWIRSWGSNSIPGLVRRGPAGCETTTYSFDQGPAHFVVLNQYFNGRKDIGAKGDVVDELFQWLKADLEANSKPMVLVFGHEPILPVPDMDNGRLRHQNDSLNAYPENCRRFHDLLIEKRVAAYFAAHTHNASITNLSGVWQVDAGHARGKGDPGAPSTFLKVKVTPKDCVVDFYRQKEPGGDYRKTRSVKIPSRGGHHF